MKTIYLAGGCFWGVEKFLEYAKGVKETEVGYANGPYLNPTYEEVRYKQTGHVETVKVIYDETVLPLSHLLKEFLSVIDPFSLNKQGEDEGVQYRTGIYYVDEEDLPVIQSVISEVEDKFEEKSVVEIKPLENYSRAEEYHQKYLAKNPNGYCHIHCLFRN
jgi:methionine-S-sulfoxide reductase